MSKYLPAAAVAQEKYQQNIRAIFGVKAGTHMRFPDAEKGPFIVRKDKLAALGPDAQALLAKQAHAAAGTKPATRAQKLKRGFKRLFGGAK